MAQTLFLMFEEKNICHRNRITFFFKKKEHIWNFHQGATKLVHGKGYL